MSKMVDSISKRVKIIGKCSIDLVIAISCILRRHPASTPNSKCYVLVHLTVTTPSMTGTADNRIMVSDVCSSPTRARNTSASINKLRAGLRVCVY